MNKNQIIRVGNIVLTLQVIFPISIIVIKMTIAMTIKIGMIMIYYIILYDDLIIVLKSEGSN